jgi:hypothetical protein
VQAQTLSTSNLEAIGLNEKDTDVSGLTFVGDTEAITILKDQVQTIQNSMPGGAGEAMAGVRVAYLSHLATEIAGGTEVSQAVSESPAALSKILSNYNSSVSINALEVFNEAVNLLEQ